MVTMQLVLMISTSGARGWNNAFNHVLFREKGFLFFMEVVFPKGLKRLEMLSKHDFVSQREDHVLKICAHIRISDHIFLCICGWDVRNFRCTKKLRSIPSIPL